MSLCITRESRVDAQKVGEELKVHSVLTGSVTPQGDDVRVNVELDDIRDGKELWGQQYTRKAADLLAIQNDIAREVSQRLGGQASAATQQQEMSKGINRQSRSLPALPKRQVLHQQTYQGRAREGHRLLQSGDCYRSQLWLGLQRAGL